MNKFDNILNLKNWDLEETELAIKYYERQLKHPSNDDQEIRWLQRAITSCEMHIEELTDTVPDWVKLFN